MIEVDAATGTARAVISEEAKTFFCYSGKRFRRDIADGREMIWMSERDGWNHLYLYDAETGFVKNQITKGQWPVRSVVQVEEDKRQIWFSASGMYPGKDPYFVHYYRINVDGTGLTALTTADANHSVSFSPDLKFYVDTYSRVDAAPIAELRRTTDKSLVLELEKADISELVKAGWAPPEVFTAKGRDGVTDIWGVIYRPRHFDPAKKYPVIENIYAGPTVRSCRNRSPPSTRCRRRRISASSSFRSTAWARAIDPRRFTTWRGKTSRTPASPIGFCGTKRSRRSIRPTTLPASASMERRPAVRIRSVRCCSIPSFTRSRCRSPAATTTGWTKSGGTSSGWAGRSDRSTRTSSNVDNASRLQGKVLLVVGEMDHNVDPSSTMQVVNQLIKHNKDFDLLVAPGMDHGTGGAYGDHKRYDFFVRHLLGINPPSWAAVDGALKPQLKSTSATNGR